jgi:hypothetical protein
MRTTRCIAKMPWPWPSVYFHCILTSLDVNKRCGNSSALNFLSSLSAVLLWVSLCWCHKGKHNNVPLIPSLDPFTNMKRAKLNKSDKLLHEYLYICTYIWLSFCLFIYLTSIYLYIDIFKKGTNRFTIQETWLKAPIFNTLSYLESPERFPDHNGITSIPASWRSWKQMHASPHELLTPVCKGIQEILSFFLWFCNILVLSGAPRFLSFWWFWGCRSIMRGP